MKSSFDNDFGDMIFGILICTLLAASVILLMVVVIDEQCNNKQKPEQTSSIINQKIVDVGSFITNESFCPSYSYNGMLNDSIFAITKHINNYNVIMYYRLSDKDKLNNMFRIQAVSPTSIIVLMK